MAMKQNFGWVRSPFDPRDKFYFAAIDPSVSLPGQFDLYKERNNTPPFLNQGSLGSCGPNSMAEDLMFDQKAEGLAVDVPSRLFIYWWTRYLMGTVNSDSGVDNRTLLKAMNQYGFCPERMWPYVTASFRTKPPQAASDAAAANRITDYAAVVQSLDQMKAAIFAGHTILFGFEVFQAIESDVVAQTGDVPMPSPNETPIGGHDVTLYGWDDFRGVFLFRNHWGNADGSPWGARGNGTIPYQYATSAKLAGDFWVVNTVPGVVPVPPPVPPVPPVPPIPVPGTVTIPASGTYRAATEATGKTVLVLN